MYQRRDFYRHSRYLHGWLSAFAFLTLLFFSVTGLLLNHPEWFEPAKTEQMTTVTLPKSILASIKQQENPSDTILNYVRQQHNLVGRYHSSEVMDDEVMIRLESPAGATDIWVMTDSGKTEITQKPASTISMLNDLHRGKNSGLAWSWLIDISAIIIIALALVGYILFLSIKTRLITHLVLTAVSLALIMVLIWSAV